MTTRIDLTVVMSVLNGERHLRDAIESILNQTLSDLQFIIVDNGSTDSTPRLLREYSLSAHQITIRRNHSTLPMYSSREKGIRAACTEWVALMDADDIAEPERLERQIGFLSRYGSVLGAVGTWARLIDAGGRVLGDMIMPPTTTLEFDALYSRNEAIVLLDPSAIIHRPTFLSIGGYRPECWPAADIDLWYRMAETGRKILVIPEFLMRYRIHAGSTSVSATMLQRKKTHFINYNMRRRRAGGEELIWEEYLTNVWGKISYRVPRLRNDLGLCLLKHARHAEGERRYGAALLNLIGATAMKPVHVVRQLFNQQIRFRFHELWRRDE